MKLPFRRSSSSALHFANVLCQAWRPYLACSDRVWVTLGLLLSGRRVHSHAVGSWTRRTPVSTRYWQDSTENSFGISRLEPECQSFASAIIRAAVPLWACPCTFPRLHLPWGVQLCAVLHFWAQEVRIAYFLLAFTGTERTGQTQACHFPASYTYTLTFNYRFSN